MVAFTVAASIIAALKLIILERSGSETVSVTDHHAKTMSTSLYYTCTFMVLQFIQTPLSATSLAGGQASFWHWGGSCRNESDRSVALSVGFTVAVHPVCHSLNNNM